MELTIESIQFLLTSVSPRSKVYFQGSSKIFESLTDSSIVLSTQTLFPNSAQGSTGRILCIVSCSLLPCKLYCHLYEHKLRTKKR